MSLLIDDYLEIGNKNLDKGLHFLLVQLAHKLEREELGKKQAGWKI